MKGLAAVLALIGRQLLHREIVGVDRADCWLPNLVHVELLGVHESLGDNHFAFEERVLLDLCQVQPKSTLDAIVQVEEADALLFQF